MSASNDEISGRVAFGKGGESARGKRRVLFVSHVGRLGGAERTLLDILQTLDQGRYAPRVVLPGPGELSESVVAEGIGVEFCPSLQRLRRSWHPRQVTTQFAELASGARFLRGLVRRERSDLVHANSTSAALFLLCSPVHLPCSVIWHLRDLTKSGPVERWVGLRATRIIVPSKACGRLAARAARPSKIELIPNGIRIAAPLPPDSALRRELAPGNGPLALIVGQLVPWKGYDLVLEAARIVNRKNPNVRFASIGGDLFSDDPGVVQRFEQKIAEAELGGVFRLLGQRDDVREIMASAELLVHPSFPEPFGRVVVEAMATGLPVVAFSGDHGPAEILRDGVDGLLVSPRTPEALAKAICALADNSLMRQSMGREGRRRASELYDRVLMTRRIERIYDAVATSDRAAEP